MDKKHVRFLIGQPVHHKMFGYRGVILEADPDFRQSDAWYDAMATTKPPKDMPWYVILVDESPCMTYVAEQNLEPDLSGKPINNPIVEEFFTAENLSEGLYKLKFANMHLSTAESFTDN